MAHGGAAARDEFGIGENGERESRFLQDGVGIRVNALPAVVNGDHHAFGGELPASQFPFQEFLHGNDGHAAGLQGLHLGAEHVRIHAHFRGGKGTAEIMIAQDGNAGFMLGNRNGGKGRGRNDRDRACGLHRGMQVRFPGNRLRIRDGLRLGDGGNRFSGNGFRHGNVFIPAVGFNQFPDGDNAGGRVPLDSAADDRSGREGKGSGGRQVGRKLRARDTGCNQENGKEAWGGAHTCNYYF